MKTTDLVWISLAAMVFTGCGGGGGLGDRSAPETTITQAPANPDTDTTPTFQFSSSEAGGAFSCQIDGGGWIGCTSPYTVGVLAEGHHTFMVRATDKAGNTDPTPATHTWTIDTSAPETTITVAPPDPDNNPTPTFEFSSDDPSATFECSVDSSPFALCTSPHTTAALADGQHTFDVKATDPTPATHTWTVNSGTGGPDLYVVGFRSGNVVRFDLATGQGTLVLTLPDPGNPTGDDGDRPRGVALDASGNIYVGLRGGTQNVLKYTNDGQPLGSFTSIGGFGTGLIAFDDAGDLIVAGDVSSGSSVFRYDGLTGALKDTFNFSGATNVVGLHVEGMTAYSVAYFSSKVVEYDLTLPSPPGSLLVGDAGTNRAVGVTVGHTGNLFVLGFLDGKVNEFDLLTGAYIATHFTVSGGGHDIRYNSSLNRYWVSTFSDTVDEYDSTGVYLRSLSHPALYEPYGMALWP